MVGVVAFKLGVKICGVVDAGDDVTNVFEVIGCDTFAFGANGCVLNACGLK